MFAWLLIAALAGLFYRPGPRRTQGGLRDRGELHLPGDRPGHRAVDRQRARRPPRPARIAEPQLGFPGEALGMSFQVVGCSHRSTPLAVRERLSFSGAQTRRAIAEFRQTFPGLEVVLLFDLQPRRLYMATGEEEAAFAAADRRFPRAVPPHPAAGDPRTSLLPRRRGSGAAPVHRGLEPRQHGDRRAADPFPSETGLPIARRGAGRTGRCWRTSSRQPRKSRGGWPGRRPFTSGG